MEVCEILRALAEHKPRNLLHYMEKIQAFPFPILSQLD